MDDPEGSRSEPRASLQAAAAVNASRSEDAEFGASERIPLVLEVLMVLMCLGAVTGNILVIIIVAATKSFRSVASVLIVNLAISDLLVGIGVMPFVALSVMDHGWVDWTDLCLFVGYTSSVFCTASVLTLAAIALDRYHSITDGLRYSSRCTLWRTCAVTLWIWLQALATSCPPLLGWSSICYVAPMYSCAVNWANCPSYTAFTAALSYLVPAVVILFCYASVVQVARGHARRIHTLEESVQRSRNPDSSHQHRGSPSRLIYHISGQFVSRVSAEKENYINPAPLDAAAEQNNPASGRIFSFRAQSASRPSLQNRHGVVRLFLVIAAFFLCWTPYIGVALVQATETALSGQSTLVPPSAVTLSYWLVLLNSDINPLLYALLSKRFQSALRGLGQQIRARLGSVVGRSGEVGAEGDDGRSSDLCTLTTTRPSSPPSSQSLTFDNSRYCPSIFAVSTDLKHPSEEHLFEACQPEITSSPSVCTDAGGDGRVEYLQVPSRPQGGSRLPFSALTEERRATFLYGQITVRVEHDIC
ncbi:5-hydroxytryptamine receptor 1D [Brachyistius frenatus]|uniref:5-hydroxytryptamine receptor 1D n=1 Tax=Brachyistius frenatus TaxID=100188 RepID=UPI0037E9C6E6